MNSRYLLVALAVASTPQIALANSGGESSGWTRSVSYSVLDSIGERGGPSIQDSRQDSKTVSTGVFESTVSINQDISSVEGSSVATETHAKAISSFAKMGVAISGAAAVNVPDFSGMSRAQATASFSDTLIFRTSASETPGAFTFHYRLRLDGTSDTKAVGAFSPIFPSPNNDFADSYANVTLFLSGTGINGGMGPRTLMRDSAQYANTSSQPPLDIAAPEFVDCAIEMFDDVPMSIFQTLTITGYAQTGNFDEVFRRASSASFDGNFAHTLTLLDGAYFTDADGNVVTDFTLSSASGFDYLHPQTAGAVPEPSAWALMIAGFGLTGMTMRRRPMGMRIA